jgi:hypothetical protein
MQRAREHRPARPAGALRLDYLPPFSPPPPLPRMYCPNISRPCSPAPRRHKPVTLRPARRALTRGSTECRPLRPLIACTHSCCRNQRALPALLPANAPGGRRARGGPRLGTAGARAGHACHQQCGRRHPAPGARPVAYASCHLLGAPVWDPPPLRLEPCCPLLGTPTRPALYWGPDHLGARCRLRAPPGYERGWCCWSNSSRGTCKPAVLLN